MRHIITQLNEHGINTVESAVEFLIKEGYIGIQHLYYQDIFDYYKALELSYKNRDLTGYKLKAREETLKQFKVSRRTFYRIMSVYSANGLAQKIY